jgi:hypothetical protein
MAPINYGEPPMNYVDKKEDIKISYASSVLEEFQAIEAPLYKKVWEYVWNDGSLYSRMRKPYRIYAFDKSMGEFYIPVGFNLYYNMNYHRIAIKVLERATRDEADSALSELRGRKISPAGSVTGETLILVAPRGKRPIVRGGFIERGTFLLVVVDRDPRRAVARVWSLILNHLKKLFRAFVRSLGLEDWMLEEYYRFQDSSLLIQLIKKYSGPIQRMFQSHSKTVAFIGERLERLRSRIDAEEVLKSIVSPLYRTVRVAAELVRRLPEPEKPSWSGAVARLADEIRLEMLLQV